MYILGIETTGPLGSVALIDEKEEIRMRISKEEMNHLKDLMPMAQQLIEEAGITKNQISAVAASIGPGSFTGIRIGVSSARAVAQALEIPCIKVNTLDVFKLRCGKGKPVAVVFNARRRQVYGAVFSEEGQEILKPGPYMLDQVLECIEKAGINPVFYGDGIDAYEEDLTKFQKAPADERYQTADMVVKLALESFNQNGGCLPSELLPNYMRETEAEQKLKDGRLAEERAAKMAKFRSR